MEVDNQYYGILYDDEAFGPIEKAIEQGFDIALRNCKKEMLSAFKEGPKKSFFEFSKDDKEDLKVWFCFGENDHLSISIKNAAFCSMDSILSGVKHSARDLDISTLKKYAENLKSIAMYMEKYISENK